MNMSPAASGCVPAGTPVASEKTSGGSGPDMATEERDTEKYSAPALLGLASNP